jgi:hypothetical protein
MSFPTEDTHSDDGPICPNCGHQFDTSDGDYYPSGMEATFEDEECPECGIHIDISVSTSFTWQVEHPQHCSVRGYHSPYVNVTDNPITNKHECLYCQTPLTCDCTLHDHCTHNLKPLEETADD